VSHSGKQENNKVSANSIQINDLLENISMKTFLKFLIKLNGWRSTSQQPMAQEMYVSIPIMAKNFCIIDFDLEEEQYNAVTQWCNENKDKISIPLRQYIEEHQDEIA
jgi:hypothetical protein